MDTKEEAKKVFLTEPLKKLIGYILASIAPLFLALIPQMRDLIQAAIPFPLLLAITSILLSGLILSTVYIIFLHKERKGLKQQIEAKPLFKFGVYWDKETNPLCPSCKSALTLSRRHLFQWSDGLIPEPIPDCLKCDKGIQLFDDNGKELTFHEAKKRVLATTNAT
jgi:hypothetical protein